MTSLDLTTPQQPNSDTNDLGNQSWFDKLATKAAAKAAAAGRTMSEYAISATTQATSYYNEAQTTLEAVSDSVETKGVTRTFWNFSAPIRRVAVRELVIPMFGDRAARVLETGAEVFISAPEGQGAENVGSYVAKEFAPELNLAVKTWDEFTAEITPEDNSLGAYYKAIVQGANYVYDLGFGAGTSEFFEQKLPKIDFGTSNSITLPERKLEDTTGMESLPVLLSAAIDENCGDELFALYQTDPDTNDMLATSTWDFSSQNFSPTTESRIVPIAMVDNVEAGGAEEVHFDIDVDEHTDESAQQNNTSAYAKRVMVATNEASAPTQPVITPTLEAVATLTAGDAAESTIAAQQELLAQVLTFGTTKDLCTSEQVRVQKQNRGTEVASLDFTLPEAFGSSSNAAPAPHYTDQAANAGARNDVTMFVDKNLATENMPEVPGELLVGSSKQLAGELSENATSLGIGIFSSGTRLLSDPFFAEKNSTALFYSGLVFLTQSKHESGASKSREQDIFDGETARALHAVTRQDSSNSGSDSSHHQENNSAEALTALAALDSDDTDDMILDDAVATPVHADTVVIL